MLLLVSQAVVLEATVQDIHQAASVQVIVSTLVTVVMIFLISAVSITNPCNTIHVTQLNL